MSDEQLEREQQVDRDWQDYQYQALVEKNSTLVRRERELADARRRIFRLEQALAQIADPEVFDLDARAMRATAQKALSQELPPPGIW